MSIPLPFAHPAFRGSFGVARRDVTPPLGIYSRSWGAATRDAATSIHRPITLTVLTMQGENDASPFALIAGDFGGWRTITTIELLHTAVAQAGISEGRYVIAMSHTHAGCGTSLELIGKPGGEFIEGYLRCLGEAIRDAIAEALRTAQPGLLETAIGKCGLATNRDLPDPAGHRLLVGWNPNQSADETLMIGRVTDAGGEPLATVINYACHPTILAWENSALSPDYVGAMREVVESATGVPSVFLQGASGELAPRHQYVGDLEVADRAGRCLGHAVLSVLEGMLPPAHQLVYHGALESGAALAVWKTEKRPSISGEVVARSVVVELEIKESYPTAKEILKEHEACTDHVLRERLFRKLSTRKGLGEGSAHRNVHELWKLGDIFFVSVPNEAYSALQTALREVAGSSPVFVSTIANSCYGYLCPAEFYAQEHYATWHTPYAPGCFEKTLGALKVEIARLG